MIIQGSPEILQGPRGLNGQFGDVPAGMSDDEYYGKINAYVQNLAVSGLSPEAAQARLLQDMAALNVTVQDLHYATSMAPTEIKSLMAIDPGLVVTTAQGTAVAKDIVYSPAPTFYACSPGFAWDGEMCRATGLADPSTYGPRILIDQDVNYYGFLQSTEYNNWMKSIEGQMLTMDIYDSPYFGFQGSGVYAGLDKVYEAYKSNQVRRSTELPITYPDCPPGSKMENGVCVGDPSTYGPSNTADEPNLRPTSYTQQQINEAIRISKQTFSDADVITGLTRQGLTSEEAVAAMDKFYDSPSGYGTSTTGGGINPALILAAAAAAFFIGG